MFTTCINYNKVNKQDLKIVFFGTPDFAVKSLDALVNGGYNIAAVVTMPDKPAGRGHHMYQSPVKEYAIAKDLPVMQPVKLKDPEFVDALRTINADLFIVIAFRMMPEVVWSMPRLGTFNLHASLLPDYRGAAPINHAIINGETITGVTTFFLKHEIDTGDIIQRVPIDILPSDNVGTLHDKLMDLGADLTIDTVNHILAGDLVTTPQEALIGHQPKPAPKIFRDTCHIDWTLPAERIHNLVRGLSPYPAAWSTLKGLTSGPIDIKIFETRLTHTPSNGQPGEIAVDGSQLYVNTGDTMLQILSLQPNGKKRMPVADYLRGARLSNPHLY